MKLFVFCLIALALLASGEALECRVCIAQGGNVCNLYTQQCANNDVCGRFWFTGSPTMLIQGCYKKSDCHELLTTPNVDGKCCDTDLCN